MADLDSIGLANVERDNVTMKGEDAGDVLWATPFSLIPTDCIQDVRRHAARKCDIDEALITDIFPCTPLQEGLMALTSQEPGSYIIQNVFVLGESVDIQRFKNAWEETVRKTDILRTIIIHHQELGSLQVVVDSVEPWQMSAPSLDAYLEADGRNPMSYGTPLSRHATLRSEYDCYFVWTVHQSVFDQSTIPLLLQRLEAIYTDTPDLLSIPFKSFIHTVQSLEHDSSADFWRRRLEGVKPCHFPQLSSSQQLPRQQNIERYEMTFSDVRLGVSWPAILYAAWALVVARNSESEDFAFGTTVSGRDTPLRGIKSIIGPTIATVPFRVRIDGDKPIEQFLLEMQEQCNEMLPFEHFGLRNISELGADAKTACDFQNLLVLQSRPESSDCRATLNIRQSTKGGIITHNYPLLVECQIGEGVVDIVAHYNPAYISTDYISRILCQFEHCARQLVGPRNGQLIRDVDILGPGEKEQLKQWNPEAPQPVDTCIHELISRHVAEQPKKQAICSWDEEFTYEELDDLSSRLSNHLATLGVATEMMIPLCFEKSAWATVAVLAVLKAGAAFVALDPSHPIDRLNGIVEEVRAPVLLSSVEMKDLLAAPGRHIIHISRSFIEALPMNVAIGLKNIAKSSNAAYVMFTSGSTGKPKGVVVEHRAWCSSALAHAKAMHMTSSSRVLQFSSFVYGGFLVETLTTLIQGGCVCVLSEEERVNDVAGGMNRTGVNWALLTPSFVRQIRPDQVPQLRTLNLGGEALTAAEIEVWHSAVKLINAYGHAETATVCLSNTTVVEGTDPKTIGRPVGVRCWVVDASDHTRLAPIGCIGELAVEAPTLARGYLNEPEKTAKSFVNRPNWFSEDNVEGLRMYKTGDLVCYNPDGSLNYVGRRDARVKIRGQRIELGEIEQQLAKSTLLGNAFVTVTKSGKLQDRLTAVISPAGSADSDTSTDIKPTLTSQLSKEKVAQLILDVRDMVSKTLTDAMIPTCWAVVDVIPTNKAKKIDRATLTQWLDNIEDEEYNEIMDVSSGTVEMQRSASDFEKKIQRIVSSVLGLPVEEARLSWSFLTMGGDSITAMQLISACRAEDIELSVQDIIRSKSLLEMAQYAKEATSRLDDDIIPWTPLSSSALESLLSHKMPELGLSLADVEDVYPCSPMQQSLLVSQAKQTGSYDVQLYWEILGNIVSVDLIRAWKTVVGRHAILRTIFVESVTDQTLFDQIVLQPQVVNCLTQIVEPSSEYAAPNEFFSRQVVLPEEYTGSPRHYFSIMRIRDRIFCRLDISHALIDGGSTFILEQDLLRACNGGLIRTDLLPSVFGNFVNYTLSQPVTENINYWKSYLYGTEPCHMRPLIHDQDMVEGKKVENHAGVKLDVSAEMIKRFCASRGCTSANLFLAAWAVTLSIFTGSESVCFGYLTSGRDAPIQGIQEAIGPFMNMLVCRLETDAAMTAEGVVERVQSDFLQGLQHQFCSLAEIQHSLGLSGASLFNTAVSFQHVQERRPDQSSGAVQLIGMGAEDYTEYDVTVKVDHSQSGFNVSLGYSSTFMSPDFAAHVASTFGHLVGQIVTQPSQKLGDMTLLGPEGQETISGWNDQPLTSSSTCFPQMFESHVLEQPNRTALHGWDGELTYSELDRLSTTLAHYLVRLGALPDSFIAFTFEKSIWAIVSMLAIVKSGAAFVPISPSDPSSRKDQILQQIRANFVLMSPTQAASWSPRQGISPIAVDMAFIETLESPEYSGLDVSPNSAAYALFTSGSTGMPKGVVIEHEALATSLKAQGIACYLSSESRCFQFASYTFDACITEIFGPLAHGGCICIPSDAARLADTVQVINELKPNWALFTPSFLKLIRPEQVPTLRVIVNGGEAMDAETLRLWQPALDHHINAYGPTEACVMCVTNESISPEGNPSCIGKGTAAKTWVVDPLNQHRLMPIGSIGELLIQGPILAREYLGDVEKTSKSFITSCSWQSINSSDPIWHNRLYKTGDLVRYNPDGSLNYLGRKDAQVKIRGQRLELGEIESHAKSKWISDILVADLINLRQRNESQVLALFVRSGDGSANESRGIVDVMSELLQQRLMGIEDHLLRSLPPYMVPSIYIPVYDMPLTVAGKTDRRKLKAWAETLTDDQIAVFTFANQKKSQPSTPTERILQQLWAEILNLPVSSIGREDNFFRLGGDSISAVRLVTSTRRSGMSIDFAAIFNSPILADMAKAVGEPGVTSSEITDDEESLSTSSWTVVDDNLDGTDSGSGDDYDFCTEDIEETYPRISVDEDQVEISPPIGTEPWKFIKHSIERKQGYATLELRYTPHHSPLHGLTNSDDPLSNHIEDIYPCSPMQQDMLLSEEKGRGYYNAHFIFKITSTETFDTQRMRWAYSEVVRRHAILRTVFVKDLSRENRLTQVVMKRLPENVTIMHCGELEDVEELLRSLPRLNAWGFRPSHRLVLCETYDGTIFLSLQINHTIVDGPSISTILSDLSQAYHGGSSLEVKAPLYREFVSHIKSRPIDRSLRYWRDYVQSCPRNEFLPASHVSPRTGSPQTVHLAVTQSSELQTMSMKAGVTVASVFRAAWALLLQKYSDSDDVLFGYVVAGRGVPIQGAQEIVGPFLNMLPCHAKLPSNSYEAASMQTLLGNIQKDYLTGLKHNHVSPGQIVKFINLPADKPLFSTLLNFRSHDTMREADALRLNGAFSYDLLWSQDPMEFDIVATIDDRAGKTTISINYWDESTSETDATQIASNYDQILSQMVSSMNTE